MKIWKENEIFWIFQVDNFEEKLNEIRKNEIENKFLNVPNLEKSV